MVLMIALEQQKIISVNFSKAKIKFCLSFHWNCDEIYLYVNKIEIRKFKANDNICCWSFWLGSVSKDFAVDEQSEISLNRTAYDFSVDHCSFKKGDMRNTNQYLKVKNKTK